MRFWNNNPDRFWASFFQNLNFFQKILENYSRALREYSMYLKVQFNLVLYGSKKIMTIRHTIKSYFRKSEKSWFLKKWNSNWVGILWSDQSFLCENFGQVSLENFLLTLQEFSKHLKSLLAKLFASSNQSWLYNNIKEIF